MSLIVEKFETKELAEDAQARKLKSLLQCITVGERFCPLINGACVPGCVCFGLPHISGNKEHGWRLYPHHCTNVMFTGYEQE